MNSPALTIPDTDPTPLFELFRGSYATELLTTAVAEFDLFNRLAAGAKEQGGLRQELGLAERPFTVLITALKAMNLLVAVGDRLNLTPLSREHLTRTAAFDVSDYVGLAADSPGVKEMAARLRSNRPAHASDDKGAAFIYRDGIESAMEAEASARHLTLALAGRAKNVAPHLARVANLSNARVLLDVGGGTGIYSVACLRQYPALKAIIWDRPEVLKVAREFVDAHGVGERVELRPGDMFDDPVPAADVVLLSNILHDWDVPECRRLVKRCAGSLPVGGKLMIHDVFLNDALDGPLPIALYSAALFTLTEGRAYSAAEYRGWMIEAGLKPGDVQPTLIHCGLLTGER